MSIVEQPYLSSASLTQMGYTKASIEEIRKSYREEQWNAKKICACCGFVMCYSWYEWSTYFQGIQIFITKEDSELPKETETERFVKLPGVDGDFIYIKEQKAEKEGAFNFTPYRGQTKFLPDKKCPSSSPYGSLYFQNICKPYYNSGKYVWDTPVFEEMDKDVKLVFMILSKDQVEDYLEGLKFVKEHLGPLVYESPAYAYNLNMGGDPRLKLFIFKKERE